MHLDPDAFKTFFEVLIPFNKHLGLQLDSYDQAKAEVVSKLELKPEFVGNPIQSIPHGGLLSFMIDATSSATAILSLDDLSLVDRVSTLDMRVDYLKASRGKVLFARSTVIRLGKRIVVVKTDVYDDTEQHIALGTNVFTVLRD